MAASIKEQFFGFVLELEVFARNLGGVHW